MMEAYARAIIEKRFNNKATSIKRFSTGLSHTVFDIITEDGRPYVVRIARPERNPELERGVYWQEIVERLDIPLPQIFDTGKINNHAYAIYERLPGADLEDVYPSLSTHQKSRLAIQVAQIQQKIHLLSKRYFEPVKPWLDVIGSIVNRSERELLAKGEENNPYIGQLRNQIRVHQTELAAVKPVAFLYDLNVRNVLVDKGELTGIIDIDELWFGDPLLAIGRGKTILMMMQADTDFITYWCQHLKLSEWELKRVDFYALLYSIRFMGTLGQRLNGNYSLQTDPQISDLLGTIANELLENCD